MSLEVLTALALIGLFCAICYSLPASGDNKTRKRRMFLALVIGLSFFWLLPLWILASDRYGGLGNSPILIIFSLPVSIVCSPLGIFVFLKNDLLRWINSGNADIRTCLAMLDDRRFSSYRASAKQALVRMGDAAVGSLIAKLTETPKREVTEMLIEIGSTHAAEKLASTLRHNNPQLQLEAAYAVGRIGNTIAVEPLIAALKDSDKNVVKVAATALGTIRDTRAVEPLIATLKDSDTDAAQAAATALGTIRDTRAVEPLIAAYQANDPNLSSTAGEALKKIGLNDLRTLNILLKKDQRVRGLGNEIRGRRKGLTDCYKGSHHWIPYEGDHECLSCGKKGGHQWESHFSLGEREGYQCKICHTFSARR